MVTAFYEITVRGVLGPAARRAFTGMTVRVEPPLSVLAGLLDPVAVHRVINRIEALGIELIDVRRLTTATPATPTRMTG